MSLCGCGSGINPIQPVTGAELERYVNQLLCTIDQKIHDVALSCSTPDDKEKNQIICDLNHIRCNIMELQNKTGEMNISLCAMQNAYGEMNLKLAKVEEQIRVMLDELNSGLEDIAKYSDLVEEMSEEWTNFKGEIKEEIILLDTKIDDQISQLREDIDSTFMASNEERNKLLADLQEELIELIANESSERDEMKEDILAKLAEEIHTREVSDTMLSSRIDELHTFSERIESLSESVSRIEKVVEDKLSEIEVFVTQIEDLSKTVEQTANDAKEIADLLKETVDLHTRQIDALNKKQSAVEDELDELAIKTANNTGTINALLEDSADNSATNELLRQKIQALSTRVDNIEAGAGEDNLSGRVDEIEKRLTTLSESVNSNLNSINTKIEDLTNAKIDLSERMYTAELSINNLSSQAGGYEAEISNIKVKQEQLIDTVNILEKEIGSANNNKINLCTITFKIELLDLDTSTVTKTVVRDIDAMIILADRNCVIPFAMAYYQDSNDTTKYGAVRVGIQGIEYQNSKIAAITGDCAMKQTNVGIIRGFLGYAKTVNVDRLTAILITSQSIEQASITLTGTLIGDLGGGNV